jgi:hypothetical protein
MKVDMSPDAISGRLDALEQLWQLSVALMDAESLNGSSLSPRRWRVSAIQDSIRKILMDEWDPIGVRGVPGAVDEYDAYIGRLYGILVGSRSNTDIIDCLARIERDEIGVTTSEEVKTRVAESLLNLNVTLN